MKTVFTPSPRLPGEVIRPRHSSELPVSDGWLLAQCVVFSLCFGFGAGAVAARYWSLDQVASILGGLMLLGMVVMAVNAWRKWRMDRCYWRDLHATADARRSDPGALPQSPSNDTGGTPS